MVMFVCKSVDYNNRSGTQRRDAENIFEWRTEIHSETDKKIITQALDPWEPLEEYYENIQANIHVAGQLYPFFYYYFFTYKGFEPL